jgi:hypothetical protein
VKIAAVPARLKDAQGRVGHGTRSVPVTCLQQGADQIDVRGRFLDDGVRMVEYDLQRLIIAWIASS